MDFLGAQVAQQQGTFNSLMENKPALESVPLLEDTQLAGNENVVGMEGLMKEVSGLYQEQARILSKNKGDLDAQKKECSLPGPSCLTVTNNIVTDFNFEGTEVRASDLFKVSSIVSFSMFSCERTSSLL